MNQMKNYVTMYTIPFPPKIIVITVHLRLIPHPPTSQEHAVTIMLQISDCLLINIYLKYTVSCFIKIASTAQSATFFFQSSKLGTPPPPYPPANLHPISMNTDIYTTNQNVHHFIDFPPPRLPSQHVRGWGSSNSDDWKEKLALYLICDNEKNHLPNKRFLMKKQSLWHSKVKEVKKVAYCYKQVSTLQQKNG